MSGLVDALLERLRERNWRIVVADRSMSIPEVVMQRYGRVPAEYAEFLVHVATCVSPDETTWFLTRDDFLGRSDAAFKWNELELQSLQAASDDTRWKSEVTAFWNAHLPILISVKSGYSFLAIRIEDGTIVQGGEPEYEEVESISQSFAALADAVATSLASLPKTVARFF